MISIKTALSLWFVLLIAVAGSGCISSYKYVRVSVTDSVTKQPVAGATISTSYGTTVFSLASRHPSQAATDESGTALVRVNYLRTEPTILGRRYKDGIVVYRAAISNDRYREDVSTSTPLTWYGIDERPSDFVPRTPDIYMTVTSEEEKARQKSEAKRKEQLRDQQVEKLFRDSPDFWPQHGKDPYPWTQGGRVMQLLLSKRWDGASTSPLGTKQDLQAIRKAVVRHMKVSKARVVQIRWLSASQVMVSAGWYGGPLASARYFYVLKKKDQTWEVLTYYMLYIS